MAATKSQGKAFSLFLVGLTVAAAGVAGFASGSGKAAVVVGLIGIAASFASFLKIKPEEGKVPLNEQPLVLKLIGVIAALLGWVVLLGGLHLTTNVSGRLFTSVIGIAISLVGILYFLPKAANKNAIWKA
jgi:hypothetical protein